MSQDSAKAVTMIIFTLFALSIFGAFAIEPTVSTIISLKRQEADNEFVISQMNTKISTLSSLEHSYASVVPDLPVILNAVPVSPQLTQLAGQVSAIARSTGFTIITFRINQVQLTHNSAVQRGASAFEFYVEGQGSYPSVRNFISLLGNFDRIVTIDTLTVKKDENSNKLDLLVQARAYFE
jgi:Tfp pilus assembly protein PilO